MTRYLLDANVFIDAKNIFYNMAVFPAFWDWLELQNKSGKVYSIEHVYEELQGHEDELLNWATNRHDDFFLSNDSSVVSAHGKLANWAQKSGFNQDAIDEFLDKAADSWLIAYAMAKGGTVVTHEEPASTENKEPISSKKEIKIPDVCKEHKIKCLNLFDMLRREKPVFVLKQEPNN